VDTPKARCPTCGAVEMRCEICGTLRRDWPGLKVGVRDGKLRCQCGTVL
jgi:hypothetical protein